MTGGKHEWLSFKIVSPEELQALQNKEVFFGRNRMWLGFVGVMLGLAIVGLAIAGIASLIV